MTTSVPAVFTKTRMEEWTAQRSRASRVLMTGCPSSQLCRQGSKICDDKKSWFFKRLNCTAKRRRTPQAEYACVPSETKSKQSESKVTTITVVISRAPGNASPHHCLEIWCLVSAISQHNSKQHQRLFISLPFSGKKQIEKV